MAKKKRTKASFSAAAQSCVNDPGIDSKLVWIAIALTIITGLITVYHWRAGYNSDTILTGMMAKNVVERGETPIFLWFFGYHGVIPHVYVSALCFKLFGVSPQVNLIFTIGAFWLALYVIFKYLDPIWGRRIAALTVLGLAVSSVEFYIKVVRPEPGYTETVLCGALLLLLARKAIDKLYVQRQPLQRDSLLLLAGAGAAAGFGFYVYQLMVYFIGVAALQVGLIAAREAIQSKQPGTGRSAMVGIAGAGVILLLDGLWAFATKSAPLVPMGHSIFVNCAVGIATLSIAVCIGLVRRHGRALLPVGHGLIAVTAGAIVGYSPKLYFTYVLHGVTQGRTGLDANVDNFIQRLVWAFDESKHSLNVEQDSFFSHVILTGWLLLLVTFSARELRRWYRFSAGQGDDAAILKLDPLTLFPWIVLPAYALSEMVMTPVQGRYVIVLNLFYALAAGVLLDDITRHHRTQARHAGWALAAFIGIFNFQHMSEEYAQWDEDGFKGEDLLQALRERNVHYGYAEYWAAYTITFYTNEDIIMQPLFSAYAPAYGPIVQRAKRVAIVVTKDQLSNFQIPSRINDMEMAVVDQFVGKTHGFYVLESKDTLGAAAIPLTMQQGGR